ncbi:MAG: hypothetical protein HY303_14850 [Candidatus Wallbacteria bacterium]|nr:hypothetical protein [Candidatus Wallbacteria bacterium]
MSRRSSYSLLLFVLSMALAASARAAEPPTPATTDEGSVEDLETIRDARDEALLAAQAEATTTPTTVPTAPRKEHRGLLDDLADKARGLGRKTGKLLGKVASDIGDTAAKAGRSAAHRTRVLADRFSHREQDLTKPGAPANLAIVIPGTDLGLRVNKQTDRYIHYDPAWAHDPRFIASIQKHWPDSQVKLFTWLSGPDPITIDAAANGLYHFVEDWRAAHPGKRVRIYAHSNGGNVSLHAAARHKPTTGAPFFADELIAAGTPLKPDDDMSTRFKTLKRLIVVFTRHDWVAGNVRDAAQLGNDPRQGVVPKILGSGHTPELAVMTKMFGKSSAIQSPTTYQYVISLDSSSATTRSVEDEVRSIYGADFYDRREKGDIGEVDASDIVAGHSDYNRPEVNVAILERVSAFDRGEVSDAAMGGSPVSPATTGAAATRSATTPAAGLAPAPASSP